MTDSACPACTEPDVFFPKDLIMTLDSTLGATKHALFHTSNLEVLVNKTSCLKNPAVAAGSARRVLNGFLCFLACSHHKADQLLVWVLHDYVYATTVLEVLPDLISFVTGCTLSDLTHTHRSGQIGSVPSSPLDLAKPWPRNESSAISRTSLAMSKTRTCPAVCAL